MACLLYNGSSFPLKHWRYLTMADMRSRSRRRHPRSRQHQASPNPSGYADEGQPFNSGEGSTRFKRFKPLPPLFMNRTRVLIILFGMLGMFILMFGQVLKLKLIEGGSLRKKAAASQHRNQANQVYRGKILDRNGIVLAQDSLVYDLYIHPEFFEDQPKAAIAKALARYLPESAAEIERKISLPHRTILLAKDLERPTIVKIKQHKLSIPRINEKTNAPEIDEKTGNPVVQNVRIAGIDAYQKPLRRYPQGRLASHVLGYVNDAAEVSSGVHAKLDKLSAAWFKQQRNTPLLVDGKGRPLQHDLDTIQHFVQVADAQDIQLTIDSRLQYIAERELADGMRRTSADRAALIMVEPKTGELLAFAAFPDYNPEQYTKANYAELKNWAITDVYEPGSTIKILTVANGLEEGVITPESHILDTGRMQVGGWPIANYDAGQRPYPGMIDLIYLLQHSSNIGSAKIALMQDKNTYYKRMRSLGFGSQTGIPMAGESKGFISKPSEWSVSKHASLGYGYGLMATPLQMAMAVNSIANGGMWVPPRLVKGVKARTHEESLHFAQQLREKLNKTKPHRVYSPETAKAMAYLLTKALDANAKYNPAYLDIINVAGKTGTAKKVAEGRKGYTASSVVTSFSGFFPADDPKILMMVVVDNPKTAESWGSTVAAPIFRRVALETIHYLGLAPEKKIELPPLPPVEKKPEAVEPSTTPIANRANPPAKTTVPATTKPKAPNVEALDHAMPNALKATPTMTNTASLQTPE
jgi:cell division protein FtsI (penicillin-binding protein 3)